MLVRNLFIVTFGAAAVAVAHEKQGDHSHSATVTKEVSTGNGLHRYYTVPMWGGLPSGGKLGPTHGGVCVDREGNVYTSTEAERGVVVFNDEGEYVRDFGPSHLHSLALVEEGETEVILAAQNEKGEVLKMSLTGEILLKLNDETHPDVPGGFKGVTAVTSGPDGSLYVVMGYGSNQLHKFDAKGNYQSSNGGAGDGEEQFKTCHGISLDTRYEPARLLVSDREKGRLVHFDQNLKFLGTYAENLRRPCAVAFDGEHCGVAELAGRVTILDKTGTPVAFLGDQPDLSLRAKKDVPPEQLEDGVFTAPHGLAFDQAGNLYVQDWNTSGRLTALRRAFDRVR